MNVGLRDAVISRNSATGIARPFLHDGEMQTGAARAVEGMEDSGR